MPAIQPSQKQNPVCTNGQPEFRSCAIWANNLKTDQPAFDDAVKISERFGKLRIR
jgi:hypothetical protein